MDAEKERLKILSRRSDAAKAMIQTQKANAYLRECRDENKKREAREGGDSKV